MDGLLCLIFVLHKNAATVATALSIKLRHAFAKLHEMGILYFRNDLFDP